MSFSCEDRSNHVVVPQPDGSYKCSFCDSKFRLEVKVTVVGGVRKEVTIDSPYACGCPPDWHNATVDCRPKEVVMNEDDPMAEMLPP